LIGNQQYGLAVKTIIKYGAPDAANLQEIYLLLCKKILSSVNASEIQDLRSLLYKLVGIIIIIIIIFCIFCIFNTPSFIQI